MLTFAVRDLTKRHELLREAVDNGWTSGQLRFRVQERTPSKRRGVGGRPRRQVEDYGPDVTLRQL